MNEKKFRRRILGVRSVTSGCPVLQIRNQTYQQNNLELSVRPEQKTY